jgi:hypothetical protein
VLVRAVDPEQLGVLASDADDDGLPADGDLEVVVRDPASESLDDRVSTGPKLFDDHADLVHLPILDWSAVPFRALLLDFNGTLSLQVRCS